MQQLGPKCARGQLSQPDRAWLGTARSSRSQPSTDRLSALKLSGSQLSATGARAIGQSTQIFPRHVSKFSLWSTSSGCNPDLKYMFALGAMPSKKWDTGQHDRAAQRFDGMEPGPRSAAEPYTCRVNISKAIVGAATAPIRAGVAVADAGLSVAAVALGAVKQSLGEESPKTVDPITDLFPLRGAIVGANRVAELTENDRAMGRALVRGGAADKLMRPGGIVDLLTAPGGLLDRVSAADSSSLERILAPGGLADRLLAEDGPLERMFAEDGIIERMFAEDGVIDKLLVKNGPLEQFTEAAEILSQLAPAVDK